MKKGLLITLVFVAVMLGSGAYAYAPVVSGIPDVVIGDDGDTDNFFRFSDAFVFDDYVSDGDTAKALLKWSFEELSGTGEITINGKEKEVTSFVDPVNELRTVSTSASFRDILASPVGGPYSSTNLSDLQIALYASDGINDSSDTIRVRSINGEEDSAGIVPTFETSFDNNDPNGTNGDYWAPFKGASGTPETTMGGYDATNKRLVVVIPASFPDSTWYQWLQFNDAGDNVQIVANCEVGNAYVLKTKLSANRDDLVPPLRLRVGSFTYEWAVTHLVGGASQAVGAPGMTAKDYYTIFEPITDAGAFLAIDYYNGGTGYAAAELYVEDIAIYRIAVPTADSV